MLNSWDPDFVGPDLDPNYQQRTKVFASSKSMPALLLTHRIFAESHIGLLCLQMNIFGKAKQNDRMETTP